jgi:hypothetical protein
MNRVFNPLVDIPTEAPQAPIPRPAAPIAPAYPSALGVAAYHGIAGEIVGAIAPHSEADPAALLVQLLVVFGNCLGRGPYYRVEATRHYTNEYTNLVGQSAKARKGTSYSWIDRLFGIVDESWSGKRQAHGLVSGEGIIHHIRDEMPGAREGEVLAGVDDKRLLIVEEEMGGPLSSAARKDNTLTAILRCAWDGKNLRTLAKNSHEIATAPHVSIIGHITLDELKAKLRGDSLTNGFANRFLWIYARRAQFLPDGGSLEIDDLRDLAERLAAILAAAREFGEIRRDPEAAELWRAEDQQLSAERPGLVGAVTSRQEAHAVRLSLIYALLDGSDIIRVEHLRAAFALCDYALRSAEYCFGGLSANAKTILNALKETAPEGLTRTVMFKQVFQCHTNSAQIDEALTELEAGHHAVRTMEQTGGKPRELWHLASPATE